MKTLIFIALFALLSAGCSSGLWDNTAAAETADALVNPENGLTADLADNLDWLSGGSDNMAPAPLVPAYSFSISTSGGGLTGFTYNASAQAYQRTASNLSISSLRFAGTIESAFVEAVLYTNADASGTPIQLSDVNEPRTNNLVKAVRYTRVIRMNLSNKINNGYRTFAVSNSLLITNISGHWTNRTALISGTRTADVTYSGTYAGGPLQSRHTVTLNIMNIQAGRVLSGSSRIWTYSGAITGSFNGTVTRESGITREISRDFTISMNGTRTVAVSVDNGTVTVDVETGEEVEQ